MGEVWNQENQHQQVQRVLEALKRASKDLQTKPITFKIFNSQTAIKAISELDFESKAIFSNDPTLFNLSLLLSNLKTQLEKLENFQGYYYYSLLSIIKRQLINYEIARLANMIVIEIQAWMDREIVQNVAKKIGECEEEYEEDEKINALIEFEKRVLQKFDRELQDVILRAKIFSILESVLCDSKNSMRIREQAGLVIATLVLFNKDVFVGLVLMGPITQALVSMASCKSLQVLSSLVKLVKSPMIDELDANGELAKIIALLGSEDLSVRVFAMDCLFEIAYYGRKEAIEAMIELGLIEKLVAWQRLDNEIGDSIELDQQVEEKNKSFSDKCVEGEAERREMEKWRPLARCAARFAVQVEVGEGLGHGEKKEVKLEILRRVREASVSEAEAATMVAEVLWGSSPMNFE